MPRPTSSSSGGLAGTTIAAATEPVGGDERSIPAPLLLRPTVGGKFLFVGGEKLHVRGVTYGTFRPDDDGSEYHDPASVDRDFSLMAASGINAVRVYTVPPRWLLDIAERHGLFVMVGLPWEQHVAFLDEGARAQSIEDRVRAGVASCAGHPAVLCYAIGNEIPAPIVRWHGPGRIERFLERLYRAAKEEDPEGLVTYVNFPSTEYLELPFVDFACFNVYLEAERALEAYLARLHNLVGDRPLVMAEIGLDSRRNGEDIQAGVLGWQVRTAFDSGCAGAFVFSWTDEWHRGGYDIEDWDFGLTDRERRPKPALEAVTTAFAEVPFHSREPWPRISVVVCTHNGAATLRDCLDGVARVDYPDYEVIVVDDGSTDATAAIVDGYDVRLISTENRGLSSARNTGMEAATGEIVAYLDDDARPDPDWLSHLALAFGRTLDAGVGGPNLPVPEDGPIADCVANAPGGPIHVLLSDREAEHIPGCNMAFRRSALLEIGGFDPQFRTAGDDVDVCWRLLERGKTLGYSPAAIVWHHRRNSVRAYWRQQRGYGRAEALLERKWPERYNGRGHLSWGGRLYGRGLVRPFSKRSRVFHGMWGSALFQSVYQPAPGTLSHLPLMPEWYLVVAMLAALGGLGALWAPLLFVLPALALASGAVLIQACVSASRARFSSASPSRAARLKLKALTALLYLLQPAARLWGRLQHGLTPWRRSAAGRLLVPRRREWTVWSERWQPVEAWLTAFEAALKADGAAVRRGGGFDRWDLEVRSGIIGASRLLMTIEEHGAGRQFVRFRSWFRGSGLGFSVAAGLGLLTAVAGVQGVWGVAVVLALLAAVIVVGVLRACAATTEAMLRATEGEPAPTRTAFPRFRGSLERASR